MLSPLLSIITVVYNNEKLIADTIESVINQTYVNKEYIIIDGASEDSTLSIIKSYEKSISVIVSEEDNGLYDAMNKGIKIAKGDVIVLLNSDDCFNSSSTLDEIADMYNKFGNNVLLVSDTVMIDSEHNKQNLFSVYLSNNFYYRIPFMHTSCVITRHLYQQYGMYDTKYKIAADVDLLLRMLQDGIKYKISQLPFVRMSAGGVSDRMFLSGRKEYRRAYISNSKNSFKSYLLSQVGYIRSYVKFYLVKVKYIAYNLFSL